MPVKEMNVPGFHVATLLMSNSQQDGAFSDPLCHPHPSVPSSTFCFQESRQPLKPKWYIMLDSLVKKTSTEQGEVGEEEGLLVRNVILS